MSNVLTVVARVRAAKGKGDALAALLTEQAAVVLKAEPGCLVYRAHRSPQDPDQFLFYETYESEAAFEAHRSATHLAAFRQRREKEGLTEGAVDVEIYRSFTE
jgi:quinol monooxygenase YgiN